MKIVTEAGVTRVRKTHRDVFSGSALCITWRMVQVHTSHAKYTDYQLVTNDDLASAGVSIKKYIDAIRDDFFKKMASEGLKLRPCAVSAQIEMTCNGTPAFLLATFKPL